ncbi:MAG: helix-turn-helix transcriptional regulator [Balneolaceae bacterium]|nr:helix-turn-helix transcriptional regulator [Balneolaceae bacterium]
MKNNVRELRKQIKLTQAELASKLDVSRQTIHAIESGDYNPSTLLAIKLSNLFGKSVNEIFFLEEGE